MKASVVKGRGILAVEESPTPRAGPGEVVIKVQYCGSRHLDPHTLQDGRGLTHHALDYLSRTLQASLQRLTGAEMHRRWR